MIKEEKLNKNEDLTKIKNDFLFKKKMNYLNYIQKSFIKT